MPKEFICIYFNCFFIVQALNSEQASTILHANEEWIQIKNVSFQLDTSDFSCTEIKYICAQFLVNGAAVLDTGHKFNVVGLKGWNNLTSCKQAKCIGKLRLVSTQKF